MRGAFAFFLVLSGLLAGMQGSGNPSSPDRWQVACGTCHRDQVDRMTSSQMFTNAGMIGQIQATWEGERPGIVFGAQDGRQVRPDGREGRGRHSSSSESRKLQDDPLRAQSNATRPPVRSPEGPTDGGSSDTLRVGTAP